MFVANSIFNNVKTDCIHLREPFGILSPKEKVDEFKKWKKKKNQLIESL